MKNSIILIISLSIISLGGCQKELSGKDKTVAIMHGIDEALKRYRHDCGYFPPREVGLSGIVDNPAGCSNWKGSYIEWGIDITKDAWGRPFVYELEGTDVLISSYGADGKLGGTGEDEDIKAYTVKRAERMF